MKLLKSINKYWQGLKKNTEIKYIILIFVVAFLLFFPSLFNFYTHDDFFLLKISDAQNLHDFLNFFNLKEGPEGLGMYRPLAMQTYFMLAWKLFNLNPLGLHLISLIFFFGIIYLIYKLAGMLVNDKRICLLAALLYATSSTHFAHLYWLSDFQELALTLFFLLSVIFFLIFIKEKKLHQYLLALLFFLFSLLSKETAVVLPLIFVLTYLYLRLVGKKFISLKRLFMYLLPFMVLLAVSFYFRFNFYGFPKGASYIWDFSPRVINTLFWYGLWSFNIPEMLVDFVGPGLRINITPLLYWKNYIVLILSSFFILAVILLIKKIELIKKARKNDILFLIFSAFWFVVTLTPVLFLPWHKFAYYLALPLIGVVILISYLVFKGRHSKKYAIILSIVWLISSYANIKLSVKSSWITKGAIIAENVNKYIQKNYILLNNQNIVFYDTDDDEKYAPWYPSQTLKTVLSDQDFFEIYFPDIKSVVYLREKRVNNSQDTVFLPAKDFVEY